jgi:hypothetical protein
MGKTVKQLPNGKELRIWRPSADVDLDRLIEFFQALPASVKNLLRYNVSDREITRARLGQVDNVNHWRLVAEVDRRIIADATMDREPYGWTRHIAQIRVVLEPAAEQLGVREILCEDLVRMARVGGVEVLSTEVFPDQHAFVAFLESLGFVREVIRKRYAKGVDGRLHDVLILSNDLESVWRHLEESLHDMDVNYSHLSGQY